MSEIEFTYCVEMWFGDILGWVRAYNVGCPPALFRQLLNYEQSLFKGNVENVRIRRIDEKPWCHFINTLRWLKLRETS